MTDTGDPESEENRPRKAKERVRVPQPPQNLNAMAAGDLSMLIKAIRAIAAPKESKEEESARLRIAESQHTHRQKVEWFVLAIGGLVCTLCAASVLTGAPDDIKKTCLATIAALATAGLGFLAGSKTAK